MRALLVPLAVATALAAVPAAAQPSPAAACAALNGATVPAAGIGLRTGGAAVTGAEMVSRPETGEFCKVTGAIRPVDPAAPPILFQVNLPTQWNRKALHMGGGGYNGTVVTAELGRWLGPGDRHPLAKGYATFGSDSGHQNRPGEDPAAFAANREALANFGRDQLKKTHDVAVALIRRRYGEAPRRMYFQGGSQGGHEGFIVAQFWPRDYDGVVAFYPVYNYTALQLSGVLNGQEMYRTNAWISPAKAQALHKAVLRACDRLDGAEDGLVSNVAGCNAAFRVESLRCAEARYADDCLTPAQIGFLRNFAGERRFGFALADGVDRFPAWPILEGSNVRGGFHLGRRAGLATPPGNDDARIYFMGDQMVRHLVAGDARYDTMAFDPARHAARLQEISRLVDANNPDLSAFRARGGKLILLHGTGDMAVSWRNSAAYYDRLRQRFGPGLRDFVRFYVVPGYAHGDGDFTVGWDSLEALDRWADGGRAPERQVAVDTAQATAGRSRPLCDYPAWPRYNGSGDVNAAASYSCATD